jgi:hypothetical protein
MRVLHIAVRVIAGLQALPALLIFGFVIYAEFAGTGWSIFERGDNSTLGFWVFLGFVPAVVAGEWLYLRNAAGQRRALWIDTAFAAAEAIPWSLLKLGFMYLHSLAPKHLSTLH